MRLPEFSVKQPVATLMLFLAVIIVGALSLTRLPIDMLPDIEMPAVSILTAWPGASASDVETEITKHIEDQASMVNNLDTLTSKSFDNLSMVSCKFEWGTDLEEATNDIRDKLELAKKKLPDDAEEPVIFKFSSASIPILVMTVTGDASWPRLYHLTEKNIADELKRVPGVGAVQLYGGMDRQINVYFDLQKINGYHLDLLQVKQVLAAENLNLPAGSIKSGPQEYSVRIPARYKDTDEIKNTVVSYFNGRPVYLKDVAEVEDAYKEQTINGWANGEKSIVLILQKQSGKNTVKVVQDVKDKLKEIEKDLPADVKINTVMDTSEDILRSIKTLQDELLRSALLVIIVTILFLRRVKAAAIIALTIPFSLVIAFIPLSLAGHTINLISLMSLAIACGLVVDDGIVALENITRHLERGGRPGTSAIFGAGEVGMAMTASTMTIVVVFVPLMFVGGITGMLFKELGFVIVVTLLASLFTALSMTPMLSSKWLGTGNRESAAKESLWSKFYATTEKYLVLIEDAYGRVLAWALSHKKTVIILAASIFAGSLALVPFIGTSFVPDIDSGDVNIEFRLPEGIRIEETNRVMEKMLQTIGNVVKPEELRQSYAFDGQSEEGFGAAMGMDEGPNVGRIGFKLVDRDKRERSASDIAGKLREQLEKIPGISRMKVTATSPLSSMMMGGGKPIVIEVAGPDLDTNLKAAGQVKKIVQEVPGTADISLSQKDPRPEIWVEVDRQKAASFGLNIAMIAGTVRNYFYGDNPTEFRDAGDSFDIFTRLSEADKNKLENLPEVPIFTPDGRMVKLKNIAEIKNGEGPVEIERKNRERIVNVEADKYGRSLGEITNDIKDALKNMDIPPGVSLSFGGEVEEQQKAFKDLSLLLVLGIVLVYMVMASLYGNFRDPLIVMFAVPFGLSGVFYAFYFTNTTLSLISFMGIIMLTGIAVKNAIILLDYTHLLQNRGQPLLEAITNAGRNRLRPILMTTTATFFGMLPLAISRGVGAELWNPLGITMMGGLAVSTLVTLVLIPTVYCLFEEKRLRKAAGIQKVSVKLS
ncbi:efflux RND transporter permease subunit [Pelotomaculum isophthalicicum JI]|uniref:Efflux RND transporter permease subunit n=1 Tax=Pelotomaculum isophthalicicum JI TaxID=947010 RepID=A0A9X4JVU8_9FIRM|nr:efflux RND transporter permease subunit [Pelotomaculum isophthalicicum]MDF9408996.1 efflux RND transporter permease subunit [Pelotomaculum isophthalicicum JI]